MTGRGRPHRVVPAPAPLMISGGHSTTSSEPPSPPNKHAEPRGAAARSPKRPGPLVPTTSTSVGAASLSPSEGSEPGSREPRPSHAAAAASRRFSTSFLDGSASLQGPKRLPAMPRKSAKYESTKGTFYALKGPVAPGDDLLGCNMNPFRRASLWYDNLNVRKKQVIALIICELLTISTLVSVHVAVLYTTTQKELEARAASEVLTNAIVYNMKVNEMAIGLSAQAEDSSIVQASVLGLSTSPAAVAARKAARRLLQQECFRRDIEYATLVSGDPTLTIIANSNTDRQGEKGFNLGGLVSRAIKGNQQVASTLLVPRSELVGLEGLFAAAEASTLTDLWLVRFVATPVYANPSDKSKGPAAVLVAGDVVNNKPYTVKPAMDVFRTGYVAVYQRAAAVSETGAGRYALSASLWSADAAAAPFEAVELEKGRGNALLDAAANAGAASSAVGRFSVNGTYMTVIARVIPDANGQPAAFMVRGLPHTDADNLLKFTLMVSLLCVVPIFALSCAVALWMGRAISHPLTTLQSTVENFFKGGSREEKKSPPADEEDEEEGEAGGGGPGGPRHSARARALERMKKSLEVRITTRDEVGKLASSFNRMCVRVSEAYARMEEERKKAAVEEYRTRMIMDAAPDAIVLMDSRCRVISLNRSAVDLFGYSPEELVGQNVNRLMPPDVAEKHDGYVRRYLNTGSRHVIGTLSDIVAVHRDGYEFPIEISLSEMHIVGSTFFIGMIRDVTVRKEMEAELEHERMKTEALLRNMLPVGIAERLKEMQDAEQQWRRPSTAAVGAAGQGAVHGALADRVDNVSIMFTDIVNFTPLAGSMDAAQLVTLLNQIFSEFDSLAEKYGLEKIKTLGDAFMCAGGVPPDRNSSRREPYAERMAKMALEMHEVIARYKTYDGHPLRIRIGMHVGTVIAGVIGKNKFLYDLWGDAVNVASRMESSGVPGRTQVTSDLYEVLKHKFDLEDRGKVHVKGKGELHTYFLVAAKANPGDPAPLVRRHPLFSRTDSSVMRSFVPPDRLHSPELALWQLPSGSFPALTHQMLDALGVSERLRVRAQELHSFIVAALDSYRDKNPFHNKVHAMDVSHAMFYTLTRLRAAPAAAAAAARAPPALAAPPHGPRLSGAAPLAGRATPPVFDDVDQFALMIAALCHDLEHPALTNLFLIKSKAPMALLYANSSPLERHHASRFLMLLERTDMDICAGLSPAERQRFTQFVIDVILATDMMMHGEYMAAFNARFRTPPAEAGALVPARPPLYGPAAPPGARLAHLDDKTLFAAMLLKCADLANAARTFENSQHWAAAIQTEFFEQGALEQELGLEVSPGMAPTSDPDMGSSARQVFFLGSIVQPLYEAVAEVAPHAMGELLANVRDNVQRWRETHAEVERRGSSGEA